MRDHSTSKKTAWAYAQSYPGENNMTTTIEQVNIKLETRLHEMTDAELLYFMSKILEEQTRRLK